MKKHLRLQITKKKVEYGGERVLRILFAHEALRDWCLGLCLLKARLIRLLLISDEHGKKQLEIQVLDTADIAARTLVDFETEVTQLSISPSQLDYVSSFFLKYYRDGVAEVDHIDLDAVATDGGSNGVGITLIVPDFAPPLSAEEAERKVQAK